jgi:hypothetical protein
VSLHETAYKTTLIYREHLQEINHLSHLINFLFPSPITLLCFWLVPTDYSIDSMEGGISLHFSKMEMYFTITKDILVLAM